MSDYEKPAYSIIFDYLLQCTNITFRSSDYESGKSIPGLYLGLSTIKKIRSGKGMSENTANKVASVFTSKLCHPEYRKIFREDLYLPLDEFKELFPPSSFKLERTNSDHINIRLFTNKLYRGYYMAPNSPRSTYMAYFKLFEKNGYYHAYMVRGIQDYNDAKGLDYCINNSPEQLVKDVKDRYNSGNKRTESIHVYEAENNKDRQDITFTNRCIKIDFHSIEEEPCFCTMFWNIYVANTLKVNTYIGGSSLIVDTNDGKRGKNICAFKMGLEAIEKIPESQLAVIQKGPLFKDSPRVVSEISLESSDGILTLDDSDDNHFYHFIQGDSYRGFSDPRYEDVNVESLVTSLFKLKADYERELDELKRFVRKVKNGAPN